jgi:hypothetical protein
MSSKFQLTNVKQQSGIYIRSPTLLLSKHMSLCGQVAHILLSFENNLMSRPQVDPDIALYKQECGKILAISPRIRYAGIINKFGRTLAGGLRRGVVPLLKPDEARNEHFIEGTRNQLRKNFEQSIGREEYTLTQNEKVKIITLSGEEHFYYITMDKETATNEVMKIIDDVKQLVRK